MEAGLEDYEHGAFQQPIVPIPFKVAAGNGHVYLRNMHNFWPDDNHAYDYEEMRAHLETDGYAMIRSFLNRDDVDTAYDFILQSLRERFPLAPKGPIQKKIGLINRQDVASAEPLRRITEHKSLYELLERLLGEEVITTGFKWLRAVGIEEFTGVHMDRVFLGGSSRMLTVWIPISKCPTWCGPIMVARGSHKDPAYAEIQRTYGESKVGADGTASGWLYDDGSALARDLGREVEWKSANFWPGDILILDSRVLHMTATNVSEEMRISCDTRWQPRSDPRDPKITSWHAQPPDMPPHASLPVLWRTQAYLLARAAP